MGTRMLASITPLNDFETWARTSALEVVMIVTGTILLARWTKWASLRVTGRIDRRFAGTDALVRSETSKHRHATVDVVTWMLVVLLYAVMAVLVVQRLGLPLAGLVAPATVIGVALGFGAQRVVQDVLAGFLIVMERQYGIGDLVRISPLGQTTGVTGTVEEVTLRITRLRATNGDVVFVPNGQIVQATNLSRDWARAVIDVPLPVTADIGVATGVLRKVCVDAYADEKLRPLLLDAPTVMGIESISVDQFEVRLVARTLPGRQFEVGRMLRVRISIALQEAGINVPPPAEPEEHQGEQP
jgi:moderate conductance mechanosensitive channel